MSNLTFIDNISMMLALPILDVYVGCEVLNEEFISYKIPYILSLVPYF